MRDKYTSSFIGNSQKRRHNWIKPPKYFGKKKKSNNPKRAFVAEEASGIGVPFQDPFPKILSRNNCDMLEEWTFYKRSKPGHSFFLSFLSLYHETFCVKTWCSSKDHLRKFIWYAARILLKFYSFFCVPYFFFFRSLFFKGCPAEGSRVGCPEALMSGFRMEGCEIYRIH